MTPLAVTVPRGADERRRAVGLVVVGIVATMVWAVVVNRILWRQPLFLYPPRFQDLREHLGDFHLVIGGHDPYYLRFRFNDTTPPLVALLYGSDQIVVMALVVVDLLVVPTRFRGYLVGVAAGILLSPVFFGLLLLRPDARSALRAAGAFLLVALLAAIPNVHASTSYWFHLLPSGEAVRRVYFSSIGRQGNSSLFAFAARAPFSHHISATALAYALGAIVAAIGLSAAWWAQTQRFAVTGVAAVGLTTATVSPVSWDHHWIWVILLPIVAIELWPSHRVVSVVSLVVIPLAFVASIPWRREGGQPALRSGATSAPKRCVCSMNSALERTRKAIWSLFTPMAVSSLSEAAIRSGPPTIT